MLKHDHTKLINFEPFKICVQLQIIPLSKAKFESIIYWIFNNPISAADFMDRITNGKDVGLLAFKILQLRSLYFWNMTPSLEGLLTKILRPSDGLIFKGHLILTEGATTWSRYM